MDKFLMEIVAAIAAGIVVEGLRHLFNRLHSKHRTR